MMAAAPSPKPRGASGPAPAAERPVLSSTALFGTGHEIVIRHGSQEYRLRITKANKLILTK
jgi:hemin uptake protein HemP